MMADAKVKVLVFPNGERYPMLFDEEGMPDFWVTLYVTESLRVSVAASTIENVIQNIRHLKLWEESEGRDLMSEFSKGKFLDDDDINSLRDHCQLNAKSLRKRLRDKKVKNVTSLELLYPTAKKNIPSVSSSHFANRLVDIASYINFTARTMLRRREGFADMCKAIDAMKDRIIAQKSKISTPKGNVGDPDHKAPAASVFDALMKVVKEDSYDNPFKNTGVRYRNALVFNIMYETGTRAGEILAIQVGDIDFQKGCVNIVRRPDNPDDPRPRQPTVKTLGRPIPITPELLEALRNYIFEVRAVTKGANKHPYLFVTHKKGKHQGHPISNSTFTNRILKPATAQFPDMFDEINRHGFRHNFNYRLSKSIDAHNKEARANPEGEKQVINEAQELHIRKDLNGWESDTTAQTYNLRHIKETADKLMREDMNAQSKNFKKGQAV
jgi:integrase